MDNLEAARSFNSCNVCALYSDFSQICSIILRALFGYEGNTNVLKAVETGGKWLDVHESVP